jgi:hypothetical protein
MCAPLTFINDLTQRPNVQSTAIDVAGYRYPGWCWLGYISFGVAFWTGVGFGIRALLAAY